MGPSLLDDDGLRGADAVARLALGAVVLVDEEAVALLHHRVERASLLAEAAEDAVLRADAEHAQPLAPLGAAELVVHVLLILLAEVLDGRKHGIRRAVAQTAERPGDHQLAHLLEPLDVALFAPARRDLVEQ